MIEALFIGLPIAVLALAWPLILVARGSARRAPEITVARRRAFLSGAAYVLGLWAVWHVPVVQRGFGMLFALLSAWTGGEN